MITRYKVEIDSTFTTYNDCYEYYTLITNEESAECILNAGPYDYTSTAEQIKCSIAADLSYMEHLT